MQYDTLFMNYGNICTFMNYLLEGVSKILIYNKLIEIRSLTAYTVMRSHTYYFDIIFSL